MNTRIFSPVVCRVMALAVATIGMTLFCSTVAAQSGAGFYTDPTTGIVYQKVTKTIETPVVETKIEQREHTVYRPQTITETKPESRTIYTPVVEYNWETRVHGWWNPFQQPTVAYHHVPKARWEPRNEVVHRTNTRTEWVAEKRTVDVPQRIVRMQRQQKVDYEPVGRVAPQQQANPPGASSAIASRLRPLDSSNQVQPFNAPRIASSTVGGSSNAYGRSADQGGMRPIELYPTSPTVHGQPLPPTMGVAGKPALPFFR